MNKLGLAVYAGGNHVFYCAGVLKYFLENGLRYDIISTYSAGSALIPYIIDNDLDRSVEVFRNLTDKNKSNFNIINVFNSSDVFPHDEIYKTAVDELVDFNKIKTSEKELRVITSLLNANKYTYPIKGIMSFIALLVYSVSKKLSKSLILKLYKYVFNLQGRIIDLRKCNSKDEIVNIIMGSSTIYPFIEMREFEDDVYMLDGKLSMFTPIGVLNDCSHVLSIHAHYTFSTDRPNLYRILPINRIENSTLNYVGSNHYIKAFEQGYIEANEHIKKLVNTPFFEKNSYPWWLVAQLLMNIFVLLEFKIPLNETEFLLKLTIIYCIKYKDV